jgi:hypothetical protein
MTENKHRVLVLKITNRELKQKETYLVEWPEYCKVQFGQFVYSQGVVHSIDEVTNCGNCLHYEDACDRQKPWLWKRRVM